MCRQITLLYTAAHFSVLLNWGCLLFLLLDEAGVFAEGFDVFAGFITSTVLQNPPFPSSPSFLSSLWSAGRAIVFRRECHLPACLWVVCLDSKHGSSHGDWILTQTMCQAAFWHDKLIYGLTRSPVRFYGFNSNPMRSWHLKGSS